MNAWMPTTQLFFDVDALEQTGPLCRRDRLLQQLFEALGAASVTPACHRARVDGQSVLEKLAAAEVWPVRLAIAFSDGLAGAFSTRFLAYHW